MGISGQIKGTINLEHTGTADLTSPTETVIQSSSWPTWNVTNGTGANQMDIIWHDQRSLSATSSENIDLAGSLVDTYGNTLTFATVKFIYVFSAAANDGLIQVGGAASNTFVNWVADATDILQVRAGGAFILFAPDATGYAVTAGTGDILKINNTGASEATYDIVIGGVSA